MTSVDELVDHARAALEAGNRLVARGYWRRATRIAPDRLDIWLDLCTVTELPAERKRCLQRILELDPTNAEAQVEFAQLSQEEKEGSDEPAPQPSGTGTPKAQAAGLDVVAKGVEGSSSAVEAALEVGSTLPDAGGSLDTRPDITDEMRRQWDEAVAGGSSLVCINHPQRETSLRCNRCGVPICTRCAVRTPVGFRCRACIKAQQAGFFTARWYDYPLTALISLLLAVPAALIAGAVGWWFALIVSPLAGGAIAWIAHAAVGRRRGQWIWLSVGGCIAFGALVALIVNPFAFVSIVIYAVSATAAAIGTLRLGRSR